MKIGRVAGYLTNGDDFHFMIETYSIQKPCFDSFWPVLTIEEKIKLPYFFLIFIGIQNYSSLIFRFAGRCSKVLNFLWTFGMSNKGNIFLAI